MSNIAFIAPPIPVYKHIFLLVLDGVVLPAAADLALLVRVGAEVPLAAGDPSAAFFRVEVTADVPQSALLLLLAAGLRRLPRLLVLHARLPSVAAVADRVAVAAAVAGLHVALAAGRVVALDLGHVRLLEPWEVTSEPGNLK